MPRPEHDVAQLTGRIPQDAGARLAPGMFQLARATERLGQGLHRYGLVPPRQSFIPLLRLPVPAPRPEKLDHDKLRAVYLTYLSDLTRAEATLKAMTDGAVRSQDRVRDIRVMFGGHFAGYAFWFN
jgi:hypothetical protein